MNALTCRIKDYIQPFERRLALEELRALTNGSVVPINGDETTASTFAVSGSDDARMLRGALTYWHSVGAAEELTLQIRREATSLTTNRDTAGPDLFEIGEATLPLRLPRRRCLRYATHGLHEYRGKFFPQLVRALINISRTPEDGIVLDPMCGSGTTLVETLLAGRSAFGLDMNPLSVFVAEIKCQALTISPTSLVAGYETLKDVLHAMGERTGQSYFATLPDKDRDYLARWFAPQALVELDAIHAAIGQLRTNKLRDFYAVCLSNILRRASWQKNDDLRVRREVRDIENGEVIGHFLDQARRSTRLLAAFLQGRGGVEMPRHSILEADARLASGALPKLAGKVDTIITSPPYATALPYLDTDRLSLIYLGLLSRDEHRSRDNLMIGNREVTTRVRAEYWNHYEANRNLLPDATCALVDRIDRLNRNHSVGFRRRNLSALLGKYFFDMRAVIGQTRTLLRHGGMAFLVVGNNRTTAGGELVEIRTADHLKRIAESLGFKAVGDIPMEMLASREIFRKNAVPSERIVALRAG